MIQIIVFVLVSQPTTAVTVVKALLGQEVWWATQGSLFVFMTNTSLDAIDTLYIVKAYRRAFITMVRSFLRIQ